MHLKSHFLLLLLLLGSFTILKSQNYGTTTNDSLKGLHFKEIDAYAKRAPLFVGLSYKKLSNYLSAPYTNDEDKVRSIAYWMTQHLKYNFRKAGSSNLKLQQPKKTLWKRNGICGDYAFLFQKLCEHSGINAEMIDGYSKGFYYEQKDTFIRADHTWNGVLINNEWKLLDVLWMGGYVTPKKQLFRKFLYLTFNIKYKTKYKYVKHLSDAYYLADGKSMAKTHLPLLPWWQMLAYPISIETFEKDTALIDSILAIKGTKGIYNFQSKIWEDRNAKKPEKFLRNGKAAHNFNPRNNRVLGNAYTDYGCYLGEEIYVSELTNEEKIVLYDNVVDSIKKGKGYNKKYKINIKEEKKRRYAKNRNFHTNLMDRNNHHIKSDRKIMNDNYALKNKFIRLKSAAKREKNRINSERRRINRETTAYIKVRKDPGKVKGLKIKKNNRMIVFYKDTIDWLTEDIYYLKHDTLPNLYKYITELRMNTNYLIDVCKERIGVTCKMRHPFMYDWYSEVPIDSIELTLLPKFDEKDVLHDIKKRKYYQYIAAHKKLIKNNKRVSKLYKSILKLLKQNKKYNIVNEEVEKEFDEVENKWLGFNLSADTTGHCAHKKIGYIKDEIQHDKNYVKSEKKKLSKEKSVERKRFSVWNHYYIKNLLIFRKRAVKQDKMSNKCIQNIRAYKAIAKEEIKDAEAELRKQEKKK